MTPEALPNLHQWPVVTILNSLFPLSSLLLAYGVSQAYSQGYSGLLTLAQPGSVPQRTPRGHHGAVRGSHFENGQDLTIMTPQSRILCLMPPAGVKNPMGHVLWLHCFFSALTTTF